MKEYRALIPIGGQLPQADKLIQINEKGDNGKEIPVTVMVSSVRSITWGTKGDKVAGVFVDFWGTPWPPILLPGDVKRRKRKHVVAYDRDTGLIRTCFNSDDVMEEVPPGSCPACAKREAMYGVTKGGDGKQ
jgi:hypothetical protein